MSGKIDIGSLLPQEIEERLVSMGERAFRAGQIFAWLTQGVSSFEEMTNLSKALREKLENVFYIARHRVKTRQESSDGTIKFLWSLRDGQMVESVLMAHKHGNTLCISTQAGCKMGCRFCASTIGGFVRNLSAYEMLRQVIDAERESGRTVSNIVLMGIGEPLDNFDAVLRFLELVNHPKGKQIGMRHITLSTCGIVEKIDKLSTFRLQLNLAVSLHAPDDETRDKLMPINRTGGVQALLATCKRYAEVTGRRVSFEYALIHGVNDSKKQAELLARQMQDVGGHVNLIPLNDVKERNFGASGTMRVEQFADILRRKGVNVTIRKRQGADIDAACGQLRRREQAGR